MARRLMCIWLGIGFSPSTVQQVNYRWKQSVNQQCCILVNEVGRGAAHEVSKSDVGDQDFRFKFAGVTISRTEHMSPSAGEMFRQ
jgi:hypothetical protein